MVRCVKLGKFTLGSGRIALQLLEHMEPAVGECVSMESAELPSASNLGAGCAPSEATEQPDYFGGKLGICQCEGWGLRTGSSRADTI